MAVGIQEISKSYAQKHGISYVQAHKIVSDVLDEVVDAIYDFGGVQFVNKFTLEVKTKNAYKGNVPWSEEGSIDIPKSAYLKARTGKALKRAITEKYCN